MVHNTNQNHCATDWVWDSRCRTYCSLWFQSLQPITRIMCYRLEADLIQGTALARHAVSSMVRA